jgi:hypothetical protein
MRRSSFAAVAWALLLAAGIGAQQQPEKKPEGAAPPAAPANPAAPAPQATPAPGAEAAPQQDRVDIGAALDGWYRVSQGSEENHVGFAHEVLARAPAGTTWRWTYDVTSEVEVQSKDERGVVRPAAEIFSRQVTNARLDDTLVPSSLDLVEVRAASELQGKVSADEAGRRIDVTLRQGERRTFPLAAEEEIYYSVFLMFVHLRQTGQLSRPGQRRTTLFTLKEDGTPPFAEVTFEIREAVKREYLGKKDVTVTPIVFLRPPPAPHKDLELTEAFVDRYGRVVEMSARGGIKHMLVKTEKEAVGNRPMIQSARRDPFRKDLALAPRKAPETTGAGVEAVVGPKTGEVDQFLTDTKKLIEDLAKAKEEKREADGERLYQKILAQLIAAWKSNQDQRLTPAQLFALEEMRKKTEEIWGGLDRLMKQLRLVYVRCLQLFDQDDCDGMDKAIKELKASQERLELVNRPELDQVVSWVGQLEPLVQRCKTRIELAKKKIVVTGTTISEDWEQIPVDLRVGVFGHQVGLAQQVRFVRPVRMAVINGESYRVGDTVESEGVRVEKIWAYGVQVSLREETREIGLQQ